MDEIGDAVIGVIERNRLSGVLTAVHRGGHGHNARVIDPSRGDIAGQLLRAGVTQPVAFARNGADTVLVLIHAPGRIVKTTELLQHAGVVETHTVNRIGAEAPRDFRSLPFPATKSRGRRVTPPVPPVPPVPPRPESIQIDD